MKNQKITNLISSFEKHHLDGLVLNPGPSLNYLTGLSFHLMERPVLFFILPGQTPLMILPELEMPKLGSSKVEIKPFPYNDDPATWQKTISEAVGPLALEGKKIGVEPNLLRFLELSFLQAALAKTEFISASQALSELRIKKEPDETKAIQKAAEISEKALLQTLPFIKPGISEKEIASELTLQLIRAGSDPELAFKPIVSTGPNSANPHAEPSDRKLTTGDLLVIDWGARYNGYISDLTRTFGIEKIESEFLNIARIVLNANQTAYHSVHAGKEAGEIDKAAREVISKSGYGEFFTHRTGHGIGLEAHEPPYIFSGNQQILELGMCFTIEPGIYLPGRNGVRIEDNVVVTDEGVKLFSSFPRDLQIL